jgi:hypothetical protein
VGPLGILAALADQLLLGLREILLATFLVEARFYGVGAASGSYVVNVPKLNFFRPVLGSE